MEHVLIVALVVANALVCQRYLAHLSREVAALRASDELLGRIVSVLETLVDRD